MESDPKPTPTQQQNQTQRQVTPPTRPQPRATTSPKRPASTPTPPGLKRVKKLLRISRLQTVDSGDGYVRGVHTAPANQSEPTHFEAAVDSADFKPKPSFADKGFASRANRAHLHKRGIKSALMHKAQRNKPLSSRQKSANERISKTGSPRFQCNK